MDIDPRRAIAACETIIQERELQNDSTDRLYSENVIAGRLLASRDHLADAYSELYFRMRSEAHLRSFFGLVLSSAARWGQGLDSKFVAERAELIEVNRRIAEVAESLAQLLDRREDFRGKGGDFADNTISSTAELISAATRDQGMYHYVEEGSSAPPSRIDLKHKPSLAEFVRTLATDAEAAQGPKEANSEEAATMYAPRAVARFFEVLFLAMDTAMSTPATLPDDFDASDATLAALANCALALDPDDRLGATMVRDFRPDHWRLDGRLFDDTEP